MYKKIETDEFCIWKNSYEIKPVATLADEYGGKAQIIIDDHCHLLLLKQENGTYKESPWIFPEAFEVLKDLPGPE